MADEMSARHVHEAGFYSSDAEFRALIVPFVEAGLAAGDVVITGYDERKSGLLRTWLDDPSAVTVIADGDLYAAPAKALTSYQRLFDRHLAEGAERIRIAGDVPHPGNGGRFAGWDRYESAINTVWSGYPLHSLCLYDATAVSEAIRDVVVRTHPYLRTPSGDVRASERYDRSPVLGGLSGAPDPLESAEPTLELQDPAAAQARHAVEQVARDHVDDHTLTDLLIGVNEAVFNAGLHGTAPTSVRVWAAPERIVVHVHDSGSGPADPLAGLVPATDSPTNSGLGLWLTHQLDLDVALIQEPGRFTVRLRGGAATPPLPEQA